MEKIVSIILIVGITALAIWSLVRSYTKPLVPPRRENGAVADEERDEVFEMPDEKTGSEEIIEENMEQVDIQLPDSTTRTLLMVALRKLNLQYEFDDDQNLLITYQGEQFRIIAENDKPWIQVQDCWWYGESLDDIDNLALLHRAVNECNIRDANKMVYTYKL